MSEVHAAVSIGSLGLRVRNATASIAVALAATAFYTWAPYFRGYVDRLYGPPEIAFTGHRFLWVAVALYSLALAAVFLHPRVHGVSKCLRCFQLMARWARSGFRTFEIDRADRLALLSTLLKAFFGPMMAVVLMQYCVNSWMNGAALLTSLEPTDGPLQIFDRFGFWFLMSFILFFDVLLFTLGYLIESKRLGNEIRSVDPTYLGWAAALMCYAPFSALTYYLLDAPREEFPQFADPTVHVLMNVLVLIFLAIYTSASLALGLKASNLTHRGVVTRGPYAFVRHPAYVCKNVAWWLGSIPVVSAALEQSLVEALLIVGSIVGWAAIYVLRAVTEEDHLRSVDGDYDAYAAKVRYRFIPGVI
jgi:isoprenylcysteine carboxyl methyltransferase (ICMT) family protein YpbQ